MTTIAELGTFLSAEKAAADLPPCARPGQAARPGPRRQRNSRQRAGRGWAGGRAQLAARTGFGRELRGTPHTLFSMACTAWTMPRPP